MSDIEQRLREGIGSSGISGGICADDCDAANRLMDEAAKAAAEADYASRIRSALVATPPDEPVVEALRGDWHGVILDGRNEHGSHVLMLPHRSIEMEQDGNGDFLKGSAEDILRDAEAKGFKVGDAVVASFDVCLDEGFFSHYEFAGISSALTGLLYGSPEEQEMGRAALAAKDGRS